MVMYFQFVALTVPWDTAASTVQCIYSSVSRASLQKTGVLLNSAGDFREVSPKNSKTTQLETFNNQKSPLLAGLSAAKEENSLKRGMPGWRRSADRTCLRANSL